MLLKSRGVCCVVGGEAINRFAIGHKGLIEILIQALCECSSRALLTKWANGLIRFVESTAFSDPITVTKFLDHRCDINVLLANHTLLENGVGFMGSSFFCID
ncbi:hypothetical protein GALL_513900 [mine drainage metagenome]|uniref:Uncharacterized protein n=1 Tax=mine drainage metagenome TaxID=410659 RepID=A0A1J5PHM9_9ZZZZ